MKLEVKTQGQIYQDVWEETAQDRWISEESILRLSSRELLDEVSKLYVRKFDQEKDKIKELEKEE